MNPLPGGWSPQARRLWLTAALLFVAGIGQLWLTRSVLSPPSEPLQPRMVTQLAAGTVARMDSPLFEYGPGWRITPQGADPTEPADPWSQPAGVLTFSYTGHTLALLTAEGAYWAYFYLTVDGQPANQLPLLPESVDQTGHWAGYKSLLAPERQRPDGPTPRWVVVHRAPQPGPHGVRLEMWRGWDAMPIRGVAVDGLSSRPLPSWPGVLLLVLGLGVAAYGLCPHRLLPLISPSLRAWAHPLFFGLSPRLALILACLALLFLALALVWDLWLLSLAGLAGLALAGIRRPTLWLAGLLLGLPFYLYPLPLLPNFALNLVEVGVWGGLVVLGGNLLAGWCAGRSQAQQSADLVLWSLWGLAAVALVAAAAAGYQGLALREWRTLFLPAALFGLLVVGVLSTSPRPGADRRLLVGSWLAGGALMALIGLWGYGQGDLIVTAEGVKRLRGLFGSPNNLALYLERTVLAGLALALFDRPDRRRWVWVGLTAPAALALYLTYSKGAQLLALPVGFLLLAWGGRNVVQRGLASKRALWGLAGVAALGLLTLLPVLDTARFQGLANFEPGSTAFFRIQLWRSSWRMGLDHWLWGVGPDNFLYAYRSGYILPSAWQEPNLNHPHNFFLDLWTRLGSVGLVVGLLFWGSGLRRLWRSFQTGREPALALGLLAAGMGGLAHGLIDASYALPDLMLVWVLLFTLLEGD